MKHGAWGHPLYKTWEGMMARCYNTNHIAYSRYGGRGISVCESWRESPWAFFQDIGEKPGPEFTLDRRDNELGYTPDNVKWSTRVEQSNNRGDNRLLEHAGKVQSLALWALGLGLKHSALRMRIDDLGWSLERALTTPKMRKR